MNILSALWTLMVWCYTTRASVATVLNMDPRISNCYGLNWRKLLFLTEVQLDYNAILDKPRYHCSLVAPFTNIV